MKCLVPEGLSSSLVEIDSLKQFPDNPRRGDVNLISESLAAFGQYRPIVVRRSDNAILAGNHTYQAAKALGWTHIAAVVIDADDDRSRRIVLADNRTSDLGWYDESALAGLLSSLPSIENTGYDARTLDRLLSKGAAAPVFAEELDVINGHAIVHNYDVTAVISFGARTYYVDKDDFMPWMNSQITPEEFIEQVRWPFTPEEVEAAGNEPQAEPVEEVNHERRQGAVAIELGDDVEIADLAPIMGGVRNHAITAVSESLRVNGQYRPIVINRRDGLVVIGYSVVEAARRLELATVKAIYIDVDTDTAKRIALMDNRTSDLAWYDDEKLARLLQEVAGMNGTGFSDRDRKKIVDEVGLANAAEVEAPRVYCKVRFSPEKVFWGFPATREDYDQWFENLQREARYSDEGIRSVLAARMGFTEAALKLSQKR